jgi:Tfp pilus assembly protein PilN
VSQQINLFNPLFVKRVKYFSVLTMLQSLAFLIVGLAAFYGYSLEQEAALERQTADSLRESAFQKERLARLSAGYSPGASQKQAEEELRATESAIAAREALLRKIQSGTLEKTAGYSEYLRALARQIVNGVWITGVTIEEGSQNLTLTGKALQADLVPVFIGKLGAESALRGRTFDSLVISQTLTDAERKSASPPAYVAFRLSSSEVSVAADTKGGVQ